MFWFAIPSITGPNILDAYPTMSIFLLEFDKTRRENLREMVEGTSQAECLGGPFARTHIFWEGLIETFSPTHLQNRVCK